MKLHKNSKVCFEYCRTSPSFYQNQFGDYCLLSFPNQVLPRRIIFEEISLWELIKYKLKKGLSILETII